MSVFDICLKAHEQGLRSLLIGGHAVIAHGHPRNTFDLDLAVARPTVDQWRDFILAEGYAVHHEATTFIQFIPPCDQVLPLDLMIVSVETFEKFEKEGLPVPSLERQGLRMVSLEHLLALKSHAVRHGHAGRVEKDVDGVIGLVKANHLDVGAGEWRELFTKMDHPNCMKNSSESNNAPSSADLDLPDWSGADWSSQRVSAETAFRLCERYAEEMPEVVKRLRANRRQPCSAEFEL